MVRGTDGTTSKTVSWQHVSSGSVDVVTEEDHTEVVKGVAAAGFPGNKVGVWQA